MILSDFDYTLCYEYAFDPHSNNHLPQIEPQVAEAAQSHHLVIATGRRAEHPFIPCMWKSGLIEPNRPVITENGGCLVYALDCGGVQFVDLVDNEHLPLLEKTRQLVAEQVTDIPSDHRLAFKMGRTMLLARIQDKAGNCPPEQQALLAEQIQQIAPAELSVSDTRASVTVQHADTSKGKAFEYYLALCGLRRSDVFVVGMGDAPNDKSIFDISDVRIGFSEAVRHMVDMSIPDGARAAALVLRSLVKSTPVGRHQ